MTLFEESASGGRSERPELREMLDPLRSGDTLVVWKLDRLSRSVVAPASSTKTISSGSSAG